jgi:ribosomal protein S27AE
MSTKLQSPEVNGDLQKEEEEEYKDQIKKNMEQEIECPRCSDIMTLSSEFDRLGYVCQECDLLLIMK